MPSQSPRLIVPVTAAGSRSIRSNAYSAAIGRLERFARDDTATILLQGESGTGKTTLAKRIHALSPRPAGPFQCVVLSALDDGVASSELFGHVVGAFTDARHARAGHFVSANRGTLFLDEISKASLGLQGKLLHAIEYGEITPVGSDRTVRVDVRIVVATNVNIETLVDEGRFLPDLYARLEHFRIDLPPLRERRGDIPGLVAEAVNRHFPAAGYTSPPTLDDQLLAMLRAADWRHNVRELDGVIHRILVDAEGAAPITLGHCSGDLAFLAAARRGKRNVTEMEIAEVLKRSNTLSDAARKLGIDRKVLRPIAARVCPGKFHTKSADQSGMSQATSD